jgi:hypothetical protein
LNLLSYIDIILTDGDSQETSQLDYAIKLFFPKAHRARCIWHIVNRGMMKYFPKALAKKNVNRELFDKWDNVHATVSNWIWSWSDDQCETEEEFNLSKALFLTYIKSEKVKEALGEDGAMQLQDFYCRRVEPHEDQFVFFRRQQRFHLDTNSNSAHEGTNKGMKYHSLPVKPTHSLVESTKILTHQSKLKSGDSKIRASQYDRSHSRWLSSPTADYLTRLGESLLQTQWEASKSYALTGPFKNQWLVMKEPNFVQKRQEDYYIPRFQRVRAVSRDLETGILFCSCFYFQRIGIVCRHILCVMRQIYNQNGEFKGISHTFIRVHWWSMYYHFGVSQCPQHQQIRKLLFELRDNDSQGPVVPHADMPPDVEFSDENDIFAKSKLCLENRCQNHSFTVCQTVMQDRQDTHAAPSTLSQDYHNFNSNDDCSNYGASHVHATHDLFGNTNHEEQLDGPLLGNEAYEYLNPRFKSIVSALQSKGIMRSDLQEVHHELLQLEGKIIQRLSQERPVSSSCQFVSSNLADHNRRKTHGTKHMKYG